MGNVNFLFGNHLIILYPPQVHASPSTRLATIYESATISCPPFSMKKFSFMNVENVVKPPQKPVVSNSFVCVSPGESFVSNPRRKHPRRLQINVP